MWHYLNIHVLLLKGIIPKKESKFCFLWKKKFAFFVVAVVVKTTEFLQHCPVVWFGIVFIISLLLLFQPF